MQVEHAFPGLPDSWGLTEDEERFETPAGAMQYAQDVAELMGYEYGNIHFTADLPQYVHGATTPQYTLDEDGELVIHSNDILISDAVLPFDVPSRYETAEADVAGQELGFEDGTADFVDTLYHELVHGLQYRDIWSAADSYTEDDLEALRLLHEGQAASNTDGASYRDAQEFYDMFVERVGEGDAPGDALRSLSEDFIAAAVQMDGGVYDFVVADQDAVEDVEELYDAVATAYGMDVDPDASYEIDYRDMDVDALGEHLARVQDAVDEGYDAVAAEGYELPTEALLADG